MIANKNINVSTNGVRKRIVGQLDNKINYLIEELILDCRSLNMMNKPMDFNLLVSNLSLSKKPWVFIKNIDIETLVNNTYEIKNVCRTFIELDINDLEVESILKLKNTDTIILKNCTFEHVSKINTINSLVDNNIIVYVDSKFLYSESLGNSIMQSGSYILYHDDGIIYSFDAKYVTKLAYFLHDSELIDYSPVCRLINVKCC